MNKQELIEFIKNLQLESKFEQMVLEIINDTQEITPQLLNSLADILEQYAEYQNNLANLYDQAANEIGKTVSRLQDLDKQELEQKLIAVDQIQEQALQAIQAKINEIKK
ncbi:MAG: hypothetical protein AB1721_02030 [Patescibacteria group bacterium]